MIHFPWFLLLTQHLISLIKTLSKIHHLKDLWTTNALAISWLAISDNTWKLGVTTHWWNSELPCASTRREKTWQKTKKSFLKKPFWFGKFPHVSANSAPLKAWYKCFGKGENQNVHLHHHFTGTTIPPAAVSFQDSLRVLTAKQPFLNTRVAM